ncbi:hypothetical protein BDR05DRAFT_965728, partial [Suillus weaverae]
NNPIIQAYEATDKNGPRFESNRTSCYVSGSASKAEESAHTCSITSRLDMCWINDYMIS